MTTMNRIHFITPTSNTDQYIQPGREVVLYAYEQRTFNRTSFSYIQSVANDPKLHGVIFLCLDLDGEDDEATAGERFGVSTLPQLVIYNGIIGPSGKLGRRRASVTDVPSVRSALKRFFGDKLRMDQFDLAASLEGAGLE